MASHPDDHADSAPTEPAHDPERVSPDATPGRESIEDTPGTDGGTSGTGGTNHRVDRDVTS